MQEAFDVAPDAPFLNPDLLRWKYFDAEPRSYVLDQGGKLLAHGCIWPVAPGMGCLIDWVSGKSIPGMGMMLARKMVQLSPVLLSIGGSEMTRKIMPKIGFVKRGELLTYARVLRPWRQFRTRPDNHGTKALLRLARNFLWSQGPVALTRGWMAEEAPAPEYLMRCPGLRLKAYRLRRGSLREGSLLLTQVGGQTRIADLTCSAEPSAYAAAIEAARRDPEACELVALGHDGPSRRALEANGFQERERRSVFVHGSTDFPPHLNMLADDLFYMNTPTRPYFT
jgi:hypothetical protein